MKLILNFLAGFLLSYTCLSQAKDPGILAGNVLDESKKAIEGITVSLTSFRDTSNKRHFITDKDGNFLFEKIAFGYYRLSFSGAGLQSLVMDSIWFRAERFDFNLNDLILRPFNRQMEEVVIYAEKPLIQSKDGNITFNAGESALAAGSTASELLTNVPLVSKDPNGKITVRGKEPKILIDDKPVELNLQQLQDLLESLPGSSIEKIEVMTNPPPQYANEQGGIINIVTKKGKVGKSARISLSAGSRGEAGINGNFNYRKQGLAISVNGGGGYNRIKGSGSSERQNYYSDSTNSFHTKNQYLNKSVRPNLRINLDYDINKKSAINVVLQFNQNQFDNTNTTEYRNRNRFGNTFRLSERHIDNTGSNLNPAIHFTYTVKGNIAGESLKLFANANASSNNSDRNFFQQYYFPDHTPNGIDSSQKQLNDNRSNGYNFRADYNRPLTNKKTIFSFGGYYNRSNSHIETDVSYLKKPELVFIKSGVLSNDFRFHQAVFNARASVKQVIQEQFSISMGTSVEHTDIGFDLYKENREVKNRYWTWLPFANINRNWKDKTHITVSYKRSIRRPGINELNPTIDIGDPYNIRFGNERLRPSTAHNFDLVLGQTKPLFFANLGLGYNLVEDIYSPVRTLLPDGKTQVTWENISNRREYELSTWAGFTVSKKIKTNFSASYTFNKYSDFDKRVNRYRNGGSFTSNINSTYIPKDLLNFTGSFTFNKLASPQGYARWSWSMNLGIQRKFFDKKFFVTFNIIDPFITESRNVTYGPNFFLQSFQTAQSRNFRLSLAYNFIKTMKKVSKKPIPAKK